MTSYLLLGATLVAGPQSAVDVPIRVRNAQINPVDLSVTYEFVNEAANVTAYGVSITRYFAGGSTLVSTQGQDWISSAGYSVVGAVAYSSFEAWLPGYSDATPGTHLHRLPSQPATTAALVDADVKLTAVIRLDGSAVGSQRVPRPAVLPTPRDAVRVCVLGASAPARGDDGGFNGGLAVGGPSSGEAATRREPRRAA